jgi:hypothetical protein
VQRQSLGLCAKRTPEGIPGQKSASGKLGTDSGRATSSSHCCKQRLHQLRNDECNGDVTPTTRRYGGFTVRWEASCDLRENITQWLAAIFVALLGPWLVFPLRDKSQQRATGLAAIAGGPLVFSPLVWILAISFFALFFRASKLRSKVLRVILFWTPTVAVSSLRLGLFSLFAYAWMQLRKG